MNEVRLGSIGWEDAGTKNLHACIIGMSNCCVAVCSLRQKTLGDRQASSAVTRVTPQAAAIFWFLPRHDFDLVPEINEGGKVNINKYKSIYGMNRTAENLLHMTG